VVAHETGAPLVADPLGGSWFVEELTDELERQAEEIFTELEARGDGSMLEGVLRAVEDGWFSAQIADSAYRFQRKVDAGEWLLVGVNAFTEGSDGEPPILAIDPAVEQLQLERLAKVKQTRDDDAVARALEVVRTQASDPTVNLMPAFLDAVKSYATLGEIVTVLAAEFGIWSEPTVR
jgi:methylmalonyl-CoA mutase N-terminal domain/subunit